MTKDNVRSFLKNPLSFMGLLSVVFESIIGIVFGSGMSQLNGSIERLPFIFVMAFFPVAVLLVFLYLVIKHHTKLYSPSDFRTDDSFIQLSREQIYNRIHKEAFDILRDSESEPTTINLTNAGRESSKTHKELMDKKRDILMDAIYKAENEGIREAERYLGVKLTPNVIFRTPKGQPIEIDGFGEKDGTWHVVEIKLLSHGGVSGAIEQAVTRLRNTINIMSSKGFRAESLLVCVVKNLSEDIKDKIENKFYEVYPEGNVLVICLDDKIRLPSES